MKANTRIVAAVVIAVSLCLAFLIERRVVASSFTVTNTNDSGAGSLRQAIIDANNSGMAATISFNIPANDPHHNYYKNDSTSGHVTLANIATTTASDDTTIADIDPDWPHSWWSITPTSQLPTITQDIMIDGLTQTGASANTNAFGQADNAVLRIHLWGVNIDGSGFILGSGSNGSIIRGVGVAGFNASTSDFGFLVSTPNGATLGGVSIAGNFIGTDPSGSLNFTSFRNIRISGSSNNTVGGTDVGSRNIIPGQGGVEIVSGANTNTVQGNYIGTDKTGTVALNGGVPGITVGAGTTGNVIGGSATGAGNVITTDANNAAIQLDGNNTTVQGNRIGTKADGTGVLQPAHGISLGEVPTISSGTGNIIGGTNPGEGNLIANARVDGIIIVGGYGSPSTNNSTTISGNTISNNGVDGVPGGSGITIGDVGHNGFSSGNTVSFNTISNNTYCGVCVSSGSNNAITDNVISGTKTNPTTGNNFGQGILVLSGPGGVGPVVGNQILRNSISNNANLGIDLSALVNGAGNDVPDGVTPNDSCDADIGPNNLQNFPVLTSAVTSGSAIAIRGTLNSTAGHSFRIEFFSNLSCDSSGHGQGTTFLGSIDPTGATDNNCNVSFSTTLLKGVNAGDSITATATDKTTSDTSEFSACLISVAGPVQVPTAMSSISGSGVFGGNAVLNATLTSNSSGVSGKTIIFTLNGNSVGSAVTNSNGVATLTGVSLSGINAGTYPNAVGASFAGDSNFASSVGNGTLIVIKADQTITVGTHAPASATNGTSFTVAATASSNLAVAYSSSGVCTNNGATFTMTSSSGTCTVKYDQAGNGNYNAAAEVTESVTAQPVATPTPTPSPTPLVCPSGQTNCNGHCVNLNNDSANCGMCGNVCPTGTCSNASCVSATPTPIALTFDGRIRDRVSFHDNGAGLAADNDPDGVFMMTLPAELWTKFISQVVLTGDAGSQWDTVLNNGFPTLGIARSLDATFENQADGSLQNVPVGSGGVFKLFAAAWSPNVFIQGESFTVTVTFADGTTRSGSVTIAHTPFVDLGIDNITPTPNQAQEKQDIDYKVHLMNKGTMLATNVLVNHGLAAFEDFDSAGVSNNSGTFGTCTSDQLRASCTIGIPVAGQLPPGQDATIDFIVFFRNASDPSAGHAEFDASSAQSDANPNDNTAQITVPIGQPVNRPSNDDLANALALGLDPTLGVSSDKGTITGNNNGATAQRNQNLGLDFCSFVNCLGIQNPHMLEPMHAGQFGDASVWYKWIAGSDGPVDFFTTGSAFNTLLAVYTFDNGYFNTVASNDDSGGATWSKVHFDAVGNKTYYIAIDGFNGVTGDLSLGWNHSKLQPATNPSAITGICAGNKPNCDPVHNRGDNSNVCTSDSDPTQLCQQYQDGGGFTVITVKGTGFTSNSQVIIRGDILKGFDNNGNPINGTTDFIDSNTLIAHVPPNPPLKIADLATTQVLTFLSSATAAAARDTGTIESIPPGTYSLAANVGLLNVIQLKNATIPVGQSQTVCGNVPGLNKFGEQTCISFTNDPATSNGPVTVTPTWFQINAYCRALHPNDISVQFQCTGYGNGQERLNQLMHDAFSVNPQQAINNGSMTVKQQFPIPTGADLAKLGALLVAQGGGNLVAQGGGNLVAAGGGNLVAQGGGNLVAQGGGNLVAQGGGNLVAQGGGNLVAAGAGNLVAAGAGNVARPEDLFVQPAVAPPLLSAADLQNGSKGWFVTSSSGGNAPTVTVTTNRDGTMTGTLTMTFDSTSNPRIQDLQGIAFTVVSNPAVVKFAANNVTVNEGDGHASVTLNRTGDTTTTVTVSYATSDGTATAKTDYMPVFGSVTFNPGETQKTVGIPLIDNGYGPGSGAQRSFTLTIGNTIGGAIQTPNVATINITNNDSADLAINPLDNSDERFFIRQHYLDFLNREPDQTGWDFWANTITSCGSNQSCIDVKRINASAAFFLSIEFQQTDYLVYRMYKAAYGNLPNAPVPIKFSEFVPDTQEIDQGVVVGQPGWDTLLENNKQAFAAEFVTRQRFTSAFPLSMTPAQFVDTLNANASNPLSQTDRNQLVSDLSSGAKTRAQVLRAVAENQNLYNAEFNRAFVLMEYFGYLRRDPNSGPDTDFSGYNFWLNKLNSFNGDFVKAEMVKAFINSTEYRRRFGP